MVWLSRRLIYICRSVTWNSGNEPRRRPLCRPEILHSKDTISVTGHGSMLSPTLHKSAFKVPRQCQSFVCNNLYLWVGDLYLNLQVEYIYKLQESTVWINKVYLLNGTSIHYELRLWGCVHYNCQLSHLWQYSTF